VSPGDPLRPNDSGGDATTARLVCCGCGLLCDDLSGTTATGCTAADRWFAGPDPPAATTVDGQSASLDDALTAAATRLATARRPLVTGLASATLEAVCLAGQLAEQLAAAVDAGGPETAMATGPTIARVGEVTAAFEELRDRADLVVFWGCDPTVSHPRFVERFVQPPLPTGSRRTVSLGPTSVLPPAADHLHLPLTDDQTVPAARLLQAAVEGHRIDQVAGPLAAIVSQLQAAIDSAACVTLVTSTTTDPSGLTGWSLAQLVRALAHRKPAFQIPLGAGVAAGGGNLAGVAASCSWRFGAPGAVVAADRGGSEFQPAEADAVRLIDRGEVDCVLVVGRLAPRLEAALATAQTPPTVIHLTDVAPATVHDRAIVLAVASLPHTTSGTMLREDGRLITLTPHERSRQPTLPQMIRAVVVAVEKVKQEDSPPLSRRSSS
jgi:formylmethanofuran dehydrogenase subunit B